MRLADFSLLENEMNNGLKAIEMKGLGQVVALFGPNGAGKTRLLNSLKKILSNDKSFIISDWAGDEKSLEISLRQAEDERIRLKEQLQEVKSEGDTNNLSIAESHLRVKEAQIEKIQVRLRPLKSTKGRLTAQYGTVPTRPPVFVDLTSAYRVPEICGLGEYQLKAVSDSPKQIADLRGFSAEKYHRTAFLHYLSKLDFNREHPQAKKQISKEELHLLSESKRIISKLLNAEFASQFHNGDAVPTLNGRIFDSGTLSSGEKRLLVFACYLIGSIIAASSEYDLKTLEGSIVLLDEPEVHLHPAALIEVVHRMRDLVGPEGQLWLATHSVSLLPHLENDEIWLVADGEVKPPGLGRGHEVLQRLVGSEENVQKLFDFTQEPHRWAAAKFAAECILGPTTAGYKEGDPQLFQINQALQTRLNGAEDVTIVDYGAGQGRLAEMLCKKVPPEKLDRIKYVGVEPNQDLHLKLREIGGQFHSVDLYTGVDAVPSKYKEQCQVVVLCNTLHEIRPTQWNHNLNKMKELLGSDGVLVLVEDQYLPVGELPNELGYLVLGAGEVEALFDISDKPTMIPHPGEKYRDRLTCIEIPKDSFNVNPESVKAAISDLNGRMINEIKLMRENQTDSRDAKVGRDYARCSQMWVNSTLALEELSD